MSKKTWEGFYSSRKGEANQRDATLLLVWIRKVCKGIKNGYGINKTNFGYKVKYQLIEKEELLEAKLWPNEGMRLGKKITGYTISQVINQAKDSLINRKKKVFLLKLDGVAIIVGIYLDKINRIYVFYSPMTRQIVQSDFIAFEYEILKSIKEETRKVKTDTPDIRDSWSAIEVVPLRNHRSSRTKTKK